MALHKKGSKSEAANYRPVSLLSVVRKVMESIIARRLTTHLESQHLISDRQFGFRKGHSATDLSLLLTSEWSDDLDHNLYQPDPADSHFSKGHCYPKGD